MGIDAMVFARRAKRCLDVDRFHNLSTGDMPDEMENRFRNWIDGGVTGTELARHCGAQLAQLTVEGITGNWVHHLQHTLEFAAAFPEDEFFVLHDGGEPTCTDLELAHGYERWPDEDKKWSPRHWDFRNDSLEARTLRARETVDFAIQHREQLK